MKRFAIIPLLLAVAACASMEWTRSDATAVQVEADTQACRDMAWREANRMAWGGYYYYGSIGPLYTDPFGRRMYAWPYYSPFADPYGYRFLEEARLADFCMRAKGYELTPLKK